MAGENRREIARTSERLLGFRKAPLLDPLSENQILAQVRITKEFSDPNR
jgi:hypothetical protein